MINDQYLSSSCGIFSVYKNLLFLHITSQKKRKGDIINSNNTFFNVRNVK